MTTIRNSGGLVIRGRLLVIGSLVFILSTCGKQSTSPEQSAHKPEAQNEAQPFSNCSYQFPDVRDDPVNWNGPVFHLSQSYPCTLPAPEKYPWEKINFKTQWRQYMASVLEYCYAGNIDVDWAVQNNKVRRWYHAPWLHPGRNGREYVHGLTHERVSEPGELSRKQTSRFQNWAVSMYNAPGGYTIGQVWLDPNKPDICAAKFPVGTVAIKLLFTQATPDQVPFLKNSPEWQAHIYRDTVTPTNPLMPRTIQTLRLLQIDFAVRDSHADTGWVFGTFVFNGDIKNGTSPWSKMMPIGLTWGNDHQMTLVKLRNGERLQEVVINPSEELPFQHLGWGGRLAGPVDNPTSSCLSCHSTAQWPALSGVVPPSDARPDSATWMQWFRNLKPGEAFNDSAAQSLDFSLQLTVGVKNFYEWQELVNSRGGTSTKLPAANQPKKLLRYTSPAFPQISREGLPE